MPDVDAPYSTPDALCALHSACFTTPRPWTAAEFAALLSSAGVFLASCAHGFALGRTVVDEAELLTLAVSPNSRRLGAGARLVAAFEADAITRGATKGFLEVAADNVSACALYRRANWQLQGSRSGYYRRHDGTRTDALLFTKSLDRP